MEERFNLLIIDGDVSEFMEPTTPYLRFCNLSWEKAVEMCRLSFDEGYECVLWRIDGAEAQADE